MTGARARMGKWRATTARWCRRPRHRWRQRGKAAGASAYGERRHRPRWHRSGRARARRGRPWASRRFVGLGFWGDLGVGSFRGPLPLVMFVRIG